MSRETSLSWYMTRTGQWRLGGPDASPPLSAFVSLPPLLSSAPSSPLEERQPALSSKVGALVHSICSANSNLACPFRLAVSTIAHSQYSRKQGPSAIKTRWYPAGDSSPICLAHQTVTAQGISYDSHLRHHYGRLNRYLTRSNCQSSHTTNTRPSYGRNHPKWS